MTEAEQAPAETFPRLYDPNRPGELTLKAHSLSGVVPLLESEGAPPINLRIASGLFEPQYLVLLHGSSSDLPLGLFTDRNEAVEFAREVRANPDAHAGKFLGLIGAELYPPHERWVSVSIIEFAGPTPTAGTQLFDLS